MLKLCHFIKDDGRVCNGIALHGQRLCHHHREQQRREMRIARTQARLLRAAMQKPNLENLASVEAAMQRISDVISTGTVNLENARFMLSILRLARSNLRFGLDRGVSLRMTGPTSSKNAALSTCGTNTCL